jgi:hypothetical protein
MYSIETEFVKNLRKTHCKGCRDEGDENFRYCDGKSVIHCYLRKTYLPEGEWHNTSLNDIRIEQNRQITKEINNRVLEEMGIKPRY